MVLVSALALEAGLLVMTVRRYGVFSLPAFLALVFFLGFPVRMALQRATGDSGVFRIFYATDSDYDVTSFMSLLAMVSMMFGLWAVARNTPGRMVTPLENPSGRGLLGGWALLGAIAITALQMALVAQGYGGLTAAIESLSRRTLGGDTGALVTNMTMMAVPLYLVAIMIWARERKIRRARWATMLLLIALLWFSLMQGRAIVVVGIWAAAYIWWRATGLPLGKRVRALILVAIPVIAIAGLAWRTSSQTGRQLGEALNVALSEGLFVVSDSLPLFDHLQVAIRFTDTYGVGSLGPFLAESFSVLIPRDIWPQKPEFVPQVLGQTIAKSDISGLPGGLLGEGYLIAGWIGAVVLAGLFGVVVGLLHRHLATRSSAGPVFAWLTFTSFYIVMGGLRTGGQGALISVQLALVYVLPLVLFTMFLRGPDKSDRRLASPVRRQAAAHHP